MYYVVNVLCFVAFVCSSVRGRVWTALRFLYCLFCLITQIFSDSFRSSLFSWPRTYATRHRTQCLVSICVRPTRKIQYVVHSTVSTVPYSNCREVPSYQTQFLLSRWAQKSSKISRQNRGTGRETHHILAKNNILDTKGATGIEFFTTPPLAPFRAFFFVISALPRQRSTRGGSGRQVSSAEPKAEGKVAAETMNNLAVLLRLGESDSWGESCRTSPRILGGAFAQHSTS